MNFDPDRVVSLIKIKGPIIPVQISKEIGQNILFTSAILSELVSKSRLKVSNIKVGGGSPLYYLPGQEPQLTRFVSNLNEKDKKTYLMLKQKGVLRDSNLDALTRFCLRQIKDFATPLQVSVNEHKELFWRYFLLPNEEAESKIKIILGIKKPEKEEKVEPQKEAPKPKSKPKIFPPLPEIKFKPKPRTKIEKPEQRKQVQTKISQPKKERQEEQSKTQKIKKKRGPKKKPDPFHQKLYAFFVQNQIKVIEEEYIKKGEYALILEVNSVVGTIHYYCIAKSKKRIDEGDISTLSIKAKAKNLPPLLITPGRPTKSAQVLLENELKGLNIRQI